MTVEPIKVGAPGGGWEGGAGGGRSGGQKQGKLRERGDLEEEESGLGRGRGRPGRGGDQAPWTLGSTLGDVHGFSKPWRCPLYTAGKQQEYYYFP